jgi:phosphoserine phosphatase
VSSRRFDVVCFDLAGTLIPRNSVSLALARRLGHEPMLEALEARFRRGEISNSEIADRSAALMKAWAWRRSNGALSEIPMIGGVRETIAALKDAGLKTLLSTVTWRFAASFYQRRFGFDAVCGTEMGVDANDLLTGRVTRRFGALDKRGFAEDFCSRRGVLMTRCAAVGDSGSDVPLFGVVGLAIALNGTADAVAAAQASLTTDDLRDVLPLLLDSAARRTN